MKSADETRSGRNRGPEVVRIARIRAAELPPRVPEGAELERAIILLGSRGRMELSAKARKELEALVGTYPAAEEATRWKTRLKQLVQR